MRVFDISLQRPAENLALDEVLLESAETGHRGEALRFWESPRPFVVVGVSQAVRKEAQHRNCEEDHVPILRRCSAGGCVLQGPGCLNYALVLGHEGRPELRTIRDSYCYILGRLAETFQRHGATVHHKGVSDLALGGKKFSGSSQKRRRHFVLHHGTLLYRFDPDAMERYLHEPEDRPQYRGPRTHRGFIRAIDMTPDLLRQIVCEAFGVQLGKSQPERSELRQATLLAKEKYGTHDWNYRR